MFRNHPQTSMPKAQKKAQVQELIAPVSARSEREKTADLAQQIERIGLKVAGLERRLAAIESGQREIMKKQAKIIETLNSNHLEMNNKFNQIIDILTEIKD